jgi:hypothetical protein
MLLRPIARCHPASGAELGVRHRNRFVATNRPDDKSDVNDIKAFLQIWRWRIMKIPEAKLEILGQCSVSRILRS